MWGKVWSYIIRYTPALPSNHQFGWFFTSVFALAAIWAAWQLSRGWIYFFSAIFLTFALITIISPMKLERLNRNWNRIGMILGKITTPIILALIFFLLITPISIVIRVLGRDELRIKTRTSYSNWVDRSQSPGHNSFLNQY